MGLSTPTLLLLACAVMNLAAVAYYLLGRRSANPRRSAWRTAICTLLVALAVPASYLLRIAEVFERVAETDAAEKSAVLARGIAASMQATVLVGLLLVVPLLMTVLLWRRGQDGGAEGSTPGSPGS
jgi:hypothetical protein